MELKKQNARVNIPAVKKVQRQVIKNFWRNIKTSLNY